MENDLVGIAGRLVDAPDGFAGVVTSGGTESILLAVLAARDARPDVTAPRMVLPTTAHAAFHKAAHWLGVEPVFVDVDPVTKRADPEAMAAAIDERTVLVVASAPSYAHGVIDPVEPIAAAAAAGRGAVPRRRLHRRLGAARTCAPTEPDQLPWTFAGRRASRASRSTCTSTPTPPRASRSCCTPRPPCAAPTSSPRPAGPATRCSTRRRSRRSPAARSPRPGPSSTTSAPTATLDLARTAREATLALAACGRAAYPACPLRRSRTRRCSP